MARASRLQVKAKRPIRNSTAKRAMGKPSANKPAPKSVKGKSIAQQKSAPGRIDLKKRREERQTRKAKNDANQKEFNRVLAENKRLTSALKEIRESSKKNGKITPKRRKEIQRAEAKSLREYRKKK